MKMDVSRVLIPREKIDEMVERVAGQINDFYGGEKLVVVGILTGAYVFTADLVRKLDMPVIVDFMQVSSYEGTESTGNITIKKDVSLDIKDMNVLIVEDIVDTGRTLKALKEMLLERQPKSLRICTAFDKPSKRVTDLVPDFNGIVVPDEFIVGYGLDYKGLFREFKDVRAVEIKE